MSTSSSEDAVGFDGFPRAVSQATGDIFSYFMMMTKTVVVVYTSDGIGFTVAAAMVRAGARVAIWYGANDTDMAHEEMLADVFRDRATAYEVNVASSDDVKRAIARVVADFGGIDVFVADAGVAMPKPLLEQTPEEYSTTTSVNVDGVVFCARFVGEIFKLQGFGNLIITSCLFATIGSAIDKPVYNASKAFVTRFGKALAQEWRPFARVNIVSPGFFVSANPMALNAAYSMSEVGRKEIERLYVYLGSDASTCITGCEFRLDAGFRRP